MFVRFTIRNDEIRNFKNYRRNRKTNWIENFKNFEIHFCCCKYRLFRFKMFVWYSKIRFISRNKKFLSKFAKYSNQLSRKRINFVVIWIFSWFCIDLIQITTRIRNRKRNRQKKSKRMIKSFDQYIFIEIFCKILFFEIRNFCFVYFSFFVLITFLFQMFRIFFVVNTFVTTYSNRLLKSRL